MKQQAGKRKVSYKRKWLTAEYRGEHGRVTIIEEYKHVDELSGYSKILTPEGTVTVVPTVGLKDVDIPPRQPRRHSSVSLTPELFQHINWRKR